MHLRYELGGDFMTMDIKTITCFKRVAELQHMSRAAEELHFSQAHLSRIIAALEEEVGVPLFDREGRGIRLNPCGKMYYEYVLKIFSLLDESVRAVRDEYSRVQAQLIIGTNTGSYIPDLLFAVQEKRPKIRIKHYSLDKKNLIKYALTDRADFNIICPPSRNMNLNSIPLHKEPGVVIYPKGHWLENRKTVHLHELENENFVGVNRGYGARDSVEIMYEEHHFKPNFMIETSDTSLVKAYVSKNFGIAVVPETIMLKDPYFKDHYCKFEEDIYGILALEWRKDKKLEEEDRFFCNVVLEHFHSVGKPVGTNLSPEVQTLDDFLL